jgi:hypothetical protein
MDLNIVRQSRNFLHVSDIVRCDGHTLDKYITSDSTEVSKAHTFLWEHPTEGDFQLWNKAIIKVCSGTTCLPYTLGKYLRKPHLPWSWYTTTDADYLYCGSLTILSLHDIYHCRRTGVGTRYRKKYDWVRTDPGGHPRTLYASVTMRDETCAILHSTASIIEVIPTPMSFLKTLESFENSSLWGNLSVDGDGEWIGQAVRNGSLYIAHNGSYMPEL